MDPRTVARSFPLGALAALLLVVACAAPPADSDPALPSGALASATPAPTSSPTVEPVAPPSSDEVAEAIEFRVGFGLRADEAWVRAVAVNPEAVTDWGVPLMPFEAAELEGRPTGDDAIVGSIAAYLAAHQDISGGLYIDQPHGGILTVLVTDDPAVHEAAIREEVGDALFSVRQVRWTEAELNDLLSRVTADADFYASIPARSMVASTDVVDNVVELTISSAVSDAAERIAAHFGAEPEQLRVTSDGTGLLLQPTGKILGRIIAPAGADMSALSPQFEADVYIGERDAVGIAVGPDGRFEIDRLPPTGYRVYILQMLADGNREVGSARVQVPPGGEVSVEIPVDLD